MFVLKLPRFLPLRIGFFFDVFGLEHVERILEIFDMEIFKFDTRAEAEAADFHILYYLV